MSKQKKIGRKRVVFQFTATTGSTIHVAGSFNGWSESAKQLKDKQGKGVYQAVCMLPKGEYEYKFIVDGVWQIDPANPNIKHNALGSLNSIVQVQ